MFTEHHAALRRLLAAVQPASILLVDPAPLTIPVKAGKPAITVVRRAALAELENLDRFELGIIANTLEHMEAKAAGILLARMRDLHTQRFVALVPLGTEWEGFASLWHDNDLLAYGMTLMARFEHEGKPLALYHFNLADYKTTPDWLNSRFWAHPERWEL